MTLKKSSQKNTTNKYMAETDKRVERDLYIVKELRKGHTRRWVSAQLEEKYGYTPITAKQYVDEIGSELNKSLAGMTEDAAEYIYNTLLATIDESITQDDRKNRLKALELLAKICKVGTQEDQMDINIHLDFDK
jgi:hypothetical protein